MLKNRWVSTNVNESTDRALVCPGSIQATPGRRSSPVQGVLGRLQPQCSLPHPTGKPLDCMTATAVTNWMALAGGLPRRTPRPVAAVGRPALTSAAGGSSPWQHPFCPIDRVVTVTSICAVLVNVAPQPSRVCAWLLARGQRPRARWASRWTPPLRSYWRALRSRRAVQPGLRLGHPPLPLLPARCRPPASLLLIWSLELPPAGAAHPHLPLHRL